ncbi:MULTISPECIES: hypothetical protein [Spirulina sp. CCY15215]|uniref:hypothetical protein n=1 Tax=Spirulina sp. CCY15215 TaxID=2767591 RepID=UPI001951DB20|nr:hypothetical protein [Spirulina major]
MSNLDDSAIDRRLEEMAQEIAECRTGQQENTNSLEELRHLTSELADIARLHQQALRLSQQREIEDRTDIREMQSEMREMQLEMRGLQVENRRILDILLNQQNENGDGS